MKVNANYTWLKCQECGVITKIIPGQKFETAEDITKLFNCECEVKPKPKKKVVKDAAKTI